MNLLKPTLIVMLLSISAYAQKGKIEPFSLNHINNNQPIDNWQNISLMTIDTGDIFTYHAASGKELCWLIIFTEGCAGTPYAMKYINEVREKYPDDVLILPISSDKYKNTDDVQLKIAQSNMPLQTFIISDKKYGKYWDDRKKGEKFRNLLFEVCKQDVIGVPYHLVFDKDKNVLYHGYVTRNEKKGIPSDFISYLLNKK